MVTDIQRFDIHKTAVVPHHKARRKVWTTGDNEGWRQDEEEAGGADDDGTRWCLDGDGRREATRNFRSTIMESEGFGAIEWNGCRRPVPALFVRGESRGEIAIAGYRTRDW